MYNYIKELHRAFNFKPECTTEREEVDSLHKDLRELLDEDGCRLLLDLIDAQNSITYETSLESFAAGFRTALGIASEMGANGHFSFEDAEDNRLHWRVYQKEAQELE